MAQNAPAAPERRSTNLLHRDQDTITAVLGHPAQLANVSYVAGLLERFRAGDGPDHLHEVQHDLVGLMLEAQRRQSHATGQLKRERRRKPVEEASSGSWQTEQVVWDRVVEQLRSVGDALAWRVFKFDRRAIMALSRNPPVSPMVVGQQEKRGTLVEWEEVELARRRGEFALLHDATSCLRIADVTVFTRDGPRLIEVKAGGPSDLRAPQRRRIEQAIAAINEGTPLIGPEGVSEVHPTGIPFRTRLRQLGEILDRAQADGFCVAGLGDGWFLRAFSLVTAGQREDMPTTIRAWEAATARASKRAGFARAQHQFRSHRFDHLTTDPGSPPLTVYPFEPGICALLVCDYLEYDSFMTWDRLAAGFRRAGFDVTCPLPDSDEELRAESPILVARRGTKILRVHANSLSQVLLELVDPNDFARAAADAVATWDASRGPLSGAFTFANERAVWR